MAPTEFMELVSIGGTGPALASGTLIRSGNNGFLTADPLTDAAPGDAQVPWMPCPVNADFPDCGPEDHGSVFDFSFGNMAPLEARTFTIFHGGAYTEWHAMAALYAVGAELHSLGQSNGNQHTGWPGTFVWGFDQVGGQTVADPGPAPVPEPASLLLLGAGIAAVARLRRPAATASRRRADTAASGC